MITDGQRVTFTNWLGETVIGRAYPKQHAPEYATVHADEGDEPGDGAMYHHVPIVELTPVEEA